MSKNELKKLNETLIPWVGKTAKLFGALNSDIFKAEKIKINKEQIIILKHLVENDGIVQNDLAHITEKDKTTLARLIQKMEKKELLRRVKCKEDNRCNKIYITSLGKEKFDKVFPRLFENALKVQEDLSKEELEKTIQVLKKVLEKIKELKNEIK